MARIGTSENPLKNDSGSTVAVAMVKDQFETPGKKQGVWWFQGNFWVWQGGEWRTKNSEAMKMEIMRWLQGKYVMINESPTEFTRVEPTRFMCDEALFSMRSLTEAWWTKGPVWADRKGPEGFSPERCVGFQDVVLCVKEGGEIVTTARDENWFDFSVLPVEYRPEAGCPRWDLCNEQWSRGCQNWGRRLQRWVGYLLWSKREFRKFLLMEGVTGAGKGTICHVVQALLGRSYFGTDCETMAGDFGLEGLQYAKVCSIQEVSRLDKGGGQKVARVVKNLVGGDPLPINGKYEKVLQGVVSNAAVMMSANRIPELPNENQGLSAKMLVLPFTVGFDEKGAEYGLKEKLVREELEGIAAWAVRGLVELEQAPQEEKWPEPEGEQDVKLQFKVLNNPLASFLETHFIQNAEGFVVNYLVRAEWDRFRAKNGAPHIPDNQLLLRLERDGGWKLKRGRRRLGVGGDQLRGMNGMSLKKDVAVDL